VLLLLLPPADDIIKHWKQFVHDVTGELLAAEQEQQQQQQQGAAAALSHGSDATAAGAAAFDSSEPGSATTSAAASVAKTCRWCSCSEEHSAEACAEQQRQQQQQRDGIGCGKDPAVAESAGADLNPSAVRIQALVNRYSYMTKFVALLNPGELALELPSQEAWYEVCSSRAVDVPLAFLRAGVRGLMRAAHSD
jgi:hypothetical protein